MIVAKALTRVLLILPTLSVKSNLATVLFSSSPAASPAPSPLNATWASQSGMSARKFRKSWNSFVFSFPGAHKVVAPIKINAVISLSTAREIVTGPGVARRLDCLPSANNAACNLCDVRFETEFFNHRIILPLPRRRFAAFVGSYRDLAFRRRRFYRRPAESTTAVSTAALPTPAVDRVDYFLGWDAGVVRPRNISVDERNSSLGGKDDIVCVPHWMTTVQCTARVEKAQGNPTLSTTEASYRVSMVIDLESFGLLIRRLLDAADGRVPIGNTMNVDEDAFFNIMEKVNGRRLLRHPD